MPTLRLKLLAVSLLLVAGAGAEEAMQADRPSQTEGPFVVAPWRLQCESDLLRLKRAGAEPGALAWGGFNLKLGLPGDSDLEWGLEDGARQTLRIKVCPWKGGSWTLGLIPFAKVGGGQDLEGGWILPGDFQLPGGWGLGGMLQAGLLKDDSGAWLTEMVQSLCLGKAFWGGLSAYGEWVHRSAPDGSGEAQDLGIGLMWALGPNLLLDASYQAGIAPQEADEAALGLSLRL